jgi:sulfur-oxidizing protein SoxX
VPLSVFSALALSSFVVVGDGIPQPLTDAPGDAARGRAIVVNRQQGLCLLCHSGPYPEVREQGNLASNLQGAGTRWTAAQLRLRVADARRLDPNGLMPSLHRVPPDDGMQRVSAAWRGVPVLDAQQVEDVVAFLQTQR